MPSAVFDSGAVGDFLDCLTKKNRPDFSRRQYDLFHRTLVAFSHAQQYLP
jgi:hypothetical protein